MNVSSLRRSLVALPSGRKPNPKDSKWIWWAAGGVVAVVGVAVVARSVSAAKRPKNCPPKVLPVPYEWAYQPDHPNALTKEQLRTMDVGDTATAVIVAANRDVNNNVVPGQDLMYPAYTVPVSLFRYEFADRQPPHGEINYETDCEMEILVPGGDNWVFIGAGNMPSGAPEKTKDPAWMEGHLFDPAQVPPGKQFYLESSQ